MKNRLIYIALGINKVIREKLLSRKSGIQTTVSQHLNLTAVSGIKRLSSKELQLLNVLQLILEMHAIKADTRKIEKSDI